jgi:hypothetical protein
MREVGVAVVAVVARHVWLEMVAGYVQIHTNVCPFCRTLKPYAKCVEYTSEVAVPLSA